MSSEALERALAALLTRHVALVESGDCGFWDVEEEPEVIAARAALVDEPAAAGAGHDLCACGSTLIVCDKCGDSRCLVCDPYDERETCGADAVPGRYQGGTDGEGSASAAADEPGETPA